MKTSLFSPSFLFMEKSRLIIPGRTAMCTAKLQRWDENCRDILAAACLIGRSVEMMPGLSPSPG